MEKLIISVISSTMMFVFKELLDDDIEKKRKSWLHVPMLTPNIFMLFSLCLVGLLFNNYSFLQYLLWSSVLFFLFNLEFAGKCSFIPFESNPAWFNSKNSWKNKHEIMKKIKVKNKFIKKILFSVLTSFSDLEHFAQTLFYVFFISYISGFDFTVTVITYIISTSLTMYIKKRLSLL